MDPVTPPEPRPKKPPFGSPERIAACKRHRPVPSIDLATGQPNGKYGCWFCGAVLP